MSINGIRTLAVAGLFAAPVALTAQALVITNATIIDAAAATPARVANIVVENGVVTAIGTAPRLPAGARVIDARGKFVIPGLWDMHAHLAALTPVGRAPEHYVAYGVLGIRDMGGLLDSLLPLRTAIRAGGRVGPDIVMAGPTLNGDQPAAFHRKVTTDAEARTAVRELKAAGVDFIKFHRALSREAFSAIADESKKQGLAFVGHVPLVMSWIEGSDAGMRTIEHIQTMPENIQPDARQLVAQFAEITGRLDGTLGDSIFAVMKRNGTWLDPTLMAYEWNLEKAGPAVAALRKMAYAKLKLIAARAARAGVPIVTGTDVLERHGEVLHTELERLVEIGMTPQQVLAAATINSATAAQRPALGRIAEGAPASFVILDANPLADIRNVRTIFAVVLRGQLLDADAVARLKAP